MLLLFRYTSCSRKSCGASTVCARFELVHYQLAFIDWLILIGCYLLVGEAMFVFRRGGENTP